jgi:hypothetical protein
LHSYATALSASVYSSDCCAENGVLQVLSERLQVPVECYLTCPGPVPLFSGTLTMLTVHPSEACQCLRDHGLAVLKVLSTSTSCTGLPRSAQAPDICKLHELICRGCAWVAHRQQCMNRSVHIRNQRVHRACDKVPAKKQDASKLPCSALQGTEQGKLGGIKLGGILSRPRCLHVSFIVLHVCQLLRCCRVRCKGRRCACGSSMWSSKWTGRRDC